MEHILVPALTRSFSTEMLKTMINDHNQFVQAVHDKKRIEVSFRSKEDGGVILKRICAPMDYGPGKRINDPTPRYWVWDYTSDKKAHTLGLVDRDITSLRVLAETFDPSEFVTWQPAWVLPRDWDSYS
jgi:hypothetical protein